METQRGRRISQSSATSTLSSHSSPLIRPPRLRLSSLPSLPEPPYPTGSMSKPSFPSCSRSSGRRRLSLTIPSRSSHPFNAPQPPSASSLHIYLLLTRLLPAELSIPILNFSGHFRRLSAHRRLETVVGARGLSASDRERRRKVYLDMSIGGVSIKRVMKVMWSIRMPSPLNGARMRAGGNGMWVGSGSSHKSRVIHPFEVILYRPYKSSTTEILRVPLSIPVPSTTKTRFTVVWDATHKFVQEVKKGDRVKLVLPAVYGRERGDAEWDKLGDGGFVRGEIWEAECYIYEEW